MTFFSALVWLLQAVATLVGWLGLLFFVLTSWHGPGIRGGFNIVVKMLAYLVCVIPFGRTTRFAYALRSDSDFDDDGFDQGPYERPAASTPAGWTAYWIGFLTLALSWAVAFHTTPEVLEWVDYRWYYLKWRLFG